VTAELEAIEGPDEKYFLSILLCLFHKPFDAKHCV